MRKIIAAINMTIDGNCDHMEGLPDKDIHNHYAQLLDDAGLILYGRKTYELMKYWQEVLENPSPEESMNSFARSIDRIPKIIFSETMKQTGWATAQLASKPLEDLVKEFRQQPGKDILVGSRSLIIQLLNLHLIDEFQLCVQPVTAGKGMMLFDEIQNKAIFKLNNTKTFKNGAIILYYEPLK